MDDPIRQVLERYGPVDKAMLKELHDTIPRDDITLKWFVDNEEMRTIITEIIVPAVVGRWLQKNNDYRGAQMFLGVKAQFIDINRKFWKLFHIVWEGRKPEFETQAEIKMDMCGHLFMSLYLEDPEYWRGIWVSMQGG